MKYIFLHQNIILFLVMQLITKSFSQQNYTFNMKGQQSGSELEILKASVDGIDCPMIPSLFYSIALVYNNYSEKKLRDLKLIIEIYNFIINKNFKGYLYQEEENMNLFLAIGGSFFENCFFGLSLSNNENLDDMYINLNELKKNNKIEYKIFSFDKWEELTNNTINSKLYLGFNHENFTSEDNIIGSCDILKNDSYWGCLFNELSINNNTILLKNESDYFYKIIFTSETYNIQFPYNLQEEFINSTDCKLKEKYDGEDDVYCDELGDKDYFEMILRNSEMNITIQIDDTSRYSSFSKENKTRITFSENYPDLIILPLIMFKNFHVQFNGESNKIYFSTKDPEILQVVKKESKKDSSDSSGSSGLTIFLVILIIIIALGIGFGVFYFLRKRSKTENDINKFNKFEDEEDFKAMDEKRVF